MTSRAIARSGRMTGQDKSWWYSPGLPPPSQGTPSSPVSAAGTGAKNDSSRPTVHSRPKSIGQSRGGNTAFGDRPADAPEQPVLDVRNQLDNHRLRRTDRRQCARRCSEDRLRCGTGSVPQLGRGRLRPAPLRPEQPATGRVTYSSHQLWQVSSVPPAPHSCLAATGAPARGGWRCCPSAW